MKIHDAPASLNRCLQERPGATVVFTNGVFDVLHAGHVELLRFARSQGDLLIVGVNDDDSVRRLKGPRRPIFPLAERMEVLAALEDVDFVVPFGEDTPLRLFLELQRVDVLVKGGDYRPEEVVGGAEIMTRGGRLLTYPFHTPGSSSDLIERILAR